MDFSVAGGARGRGRGRGRETRISFARLIGFRHAAARLLLVELSFRSREAGKGYPESKRPRHTSNRSCERTCRIEVSRRRRKLFERSLNNHHLACIPAAPLFPFLRSSFSLCVCSSSASSIGLRFETHPLPCSYPARNLDGSRTRSRQSARSSPLDITP